MTKKKFAITAALPVLFVLLSCFLYFTTFDGRIFDIFMRLMPSLKEDPEVLIVMIDDDAINQAGLFPWPRDIIADNLVLMREMGARNVLFDLSYIDKGPASVDGKYVREELPRYIDYDFRKIDETTGQVLDAIASGAVGRGDIPGLKRELVENNQTVKQSLQSSISYVTRDLDEYFANSLRFFGNSYLTLTMIAPKDLGPGQTSFDMSGYDLAWIEENRSLKGIVAKGDRTTPEAVGFMPTIPILMKAGRDAGFVNAPIDPDSYRRRIHLVEKYGGKYYGHLILKPLVDLLGNPSLQVTDRHFTFKGATVNGKKTDITVPRANDGSMLIKWPKKKYYADNGTPGLNALSCYDLIVNEQIEENLMDNLRTMGDNGYFSVWDGEKTPVERFDEAKYVREALYQGEVQDEGITIDTYREYREAFFDDVRKFSGSYYRNAALSLIDQDDPAAVSAVNGFFDAIGKDMAELDKSRLKLKAILKDATCVIGTTATSTSDFGLTAYDEHFPNVGTYTTAINQILSRDFVDDASPIPSIILALVITLAMAFIIRKLEPGQALIMGGITLVALVLFDFLFFRISNKYIGLGVPLISTAGLFLTLTVYRFIKTQREKSFLRSAFSRYLSPAVITEIIADPSKLTLGGEKREMTAVFTDIRGFSTISEKMDPAALVNLLNLYLTEMSNIILENKGTIDKYEGDAIIAFFGAPIHMDEHAYLCCKTAIQMKKAEVILNQKVMDEGLSPTPIFTRIGINTGDMIVGNMGTPNKMDYTIMGNAVNLAARLEGVNKQYDTGGILISEHTRARIGEDFLVRRLDRVRVVGVQTPLRLYELIDMKESVTAADAARVAKWEEAIDLFERREFAKAKEAFVAVNADNPSDGVARTYLKKCDDFIANPPDADWDGVSSLTQK